MNYILELLPIMPFAVIITAIIYGIFLKKTKNRRIFIYDHNKWAVTYRYREDREKKESRISFETAVKSAEEYLKNFNMDTSKLTVFADCLEEIK